MNPGQLDHEASVRPFAQPMEHLLDELARVRAMLARFAIYNQLWPTDSTGGPADQFVSSTEAKWCIAGRLKGSRLSLNAQEQAQLESLREYLHDSHDAIEKRVAATLHAGQIMLPLHELRRLCGLQDAEVDLLLVAAAPLLDVRYQRTYSHLWADFTKKQVDVAFLIDVTSESHAEMEQQRDLLSSGSRLIRHRLLVLNECPSWNPPTPLLHRPVQVPDPVLDFLRGRLAPLPAAGSWLCRRATTDLSELVLAPGYRELVRRSADDHATVAGPRFVFLGPEGIGKLSLASGLAQPRHGHLIIVELDHCAEEPDKLRGQLGDAFREALLTDAGLVFRLGSHSSQGSALSRGQDWSRLLLEVLTSDHPGFLAITSVQRPDWLQHLPDFLVFSPPFPTTVEQTELWQQALRTSGATPLDSTQLSLLVSQFGLTAGQIRAAVYLAQRQQVVTRPAATLGLPLLMTAVQNQLSARLSFISQRVGKTYTWNDVILLPNSMKKIREILNYARQQKKVLEQWGFDRKVAYGRGLSALFSGSPGTGKTMVASLIASELGRELYRIDLSSVMSKWVGETEKNLARIFDEAESSQVILLFDEADSLFGKRTAQNSVQDRYSNIQVNYLLQRIESYDGICILTTNLPANLDEAFLRRIRFKVHFDMPEAAQRKQIWKVSFPPAAPLASRIPWQHLADRFDMSGGHIKNAVLRAAIEAAAREVSISGSLLIKAAEDELVEMGRVVCEAGEVPD